MPDPYDVLTIAAVVDELNETIGNGRIQRVGLVDARSVAAEVYAAGRRHYLLMSADDRQPLLHLVPEMPSLDPELRTPFGLLLRKYIRGSMILDVDQPPLERIARFSIAKRVESPDRTVSPSFPLELEEEPDDDDGFSAGDAGEILIRNFSLYVELMGRHSNLILVDEENRVVESAKHVTPAMSRVRPILPRLPYLPPPPPDRLDPRAMTSAGAERFLLDMSPRDSLSRALVRHFRGLSPQMANEIAFQTTGSTESRASELDPSSAPKLAQNTLSLLEPLRATRWSPRVYRQRTEDGVGAAVACSPVSMTHLAAQYDEELVASISSALTEVELGGEVRDDRRHLQRRQRLISEVESARDKAERRLTALTNELQRATEAEHLRRAGELIYGYLWRIQPGQAELEAEDVTVTLDPHLSPQENAQSYFGRYRKAQSASAHLPELEAATRSELAYLEQLTTLITQAPGFAELEALAAEWNELVNPAPTSGKPKRKNAPRRPAPLVDAQDNSVYVGHSGPQNDLITFEIGGPDDLWLHARGVPGSHVIIHWRSAPEEVQETVSAAAALAAWYSAARHSGNVEVDLASRRHVRKIKGGKPGMVTYRNERTVRVHPQSEAELRDVLRSR